MIIIGDDDNSENNCDINIWSNGYWEVLCFYNGPVTQHYAQFAGMVTQGDCWKESK